MERASYLHSAMPLALNAPLLQLDQRWITCRMSAPAAQAGNRGWWGQWAMKGVARFEGLRPRTQRGPSSNRRALAPPDAHHAVGSGADLLGALDACTCHARVLYAFDTG